MWFPYLVWGDRQSLGKAVNCLTLWVKEWKTQTVILRVPVPNPSLNVPIVLCSLNSLNYVMDLQFNISDIITSYYWKQRRHVPVWKSKDIAPRKGISSSCLFPSHMHMQIFLHKSLYTYLSVHSLFLGFQGCSSFMLLGSGWKVLWLIKFMVIIIGSGSKRCPAIWTLVYVGRLK